MDFDITVHSQVRSRTDQALLIRAAQVALRHGKVKSASLSIRVLGDRAMRAQNLQALNHDYTTDVLSWNLGETPEYQLMGELAVCLAYAKRSAARRCLSVREEMARYVVHGCLHLLGHDDGDEASKATMWKAQERLVTSLMKRQATKKSPTRTRKA
jgi:probable rRNA maturation factor